MFWLFEESSDLSQIICDNFLLFREYLSQIKTKFENISRLLSGACEVSFHEKNQDPTAPLNSSSPPCLVVAPPPPTTTVFFLWPRFLPPPFLPSHYVLPAKFLITRKLKFLLLKGLSSVIFIASFLVSLHDQLINMSWWQNSVNPVNSPGSAHQVTRQISGTAPRNHSELVSIPPSPTQRW
jgi:hypothetical protein